MLSSMYKAIGAFPNPFGLNVILYIPKFQADIKFVKIFKLLNFNIT